MTLISFVKSKLTNALIRTLASSHLYAGVSARTKGSSEMAHINLEVNRPLNKSERDLLVWLANNLTMSVQAPLNEIPYLEVASTCKCGCASIDFSLKGNPISGNDGITVIADYLYKSQSNSQMGCFLFMADGHLAGIEVWSVDGTESPSELPGPSELYSYEQAPR